MSGFGWSISCTQNFRSEYFANLGYDLFIVPIAPQQTVDLAVKSPMCCSAWLVRTVKEEKAQNLDICYHSMVLNFAGIEIDLAIPSLRVRKGVKREFKDALAKATSKAKDGGQAETGTGQDVLVSFVLGRGLTDDELAVVAEKERVSKKKQNEKKKRAEALQAIEDFDITDTIADRQVPIAPSLFRRIMK